VTDSNLIGGGSTSATRSFAPRQESRAARIIDANGRGETGGPDLNNRDSNDRDLNNRDLNSMDETSSSLARSALVTAALLALAGSGLGLFAIHAGMVSGLEALVVLSGGVFSLAILCTPFIYRKHSIQTVATLSIVFYLLYICSGASLALLGKGGHQSLFAYLFWAFALLMLNKLVNSPAVGRLLHIVILAAPLLIVSCLSYRVVTVFTQQTIYVTIAFCLSYLCFGLMLNATTRYREAYFTEREHSASMRIESEVLESISDCFLSLDPDFRLVYINDAACWEFATERRSVLNCALEEAAPAFFSPPMLSALHGSTEQNATTVFEVQNAGGQWYEMRCFPQPRRLSVYFRNITAQVLSRRQLDLAHDRLREQSDLLNKAQDAIFVQDLNLRVRYWNHGAERLFGWTADEVRGRRTDELFDSSAADVRKAIESAARDGEWSGELTKKDKRGKTLMVESRCTLVRDEAGEAHSILVINTDITQRKAADARIYRLAFHDVLTGLGNRALLRERLERILGEPRALRRGGALLLIDLDDFKTLNDTSGHDMGDLLLREVAERLVRCMRMGDSVARLGGDEFVILIEDLSPESRPAMEESRAIAESILAACRLPFVLPHYQFEGTASIGATLLEGGPETLDDLFRRVDLAMYQAKAQGRNNVCFFDPWLETSAAARAELLADLKRALVNGEFELHYQPQVDSRRVVTGCEALLRWRHPQRGMVSPGEFIPLAESSGLIVELGYWVLQTACAQLAEWARTPQTASLTAAVNVSIRQFLDPRFVQLVMGVLRESGADPAKLKLEITESFMVEKVDESIDKMTAIKALGVAFSMDDFGTGYSSLSQLKRLPLDQLKIDQSFVRDVLTGEKDASIVRTIIALGKSLSISTLAEGVETEGQRAFLEAEGCGLYQGYLFSPALPAVAFEAFVQRLNRERESAAA